jgi:hypothetical protein
MYGGLVGPTLSQERYISTSHDDQEFVSRRHAQSFARLLWKIWFFREIVVSAMLFILSESKTLASSHNGSTIKFLCFTTTSQNKPCSYRLNAP